MPSANVLSNEQESNCFKNVTNQLFDIILALSGLNTTGITHILRIFVCSFVSRLNVPVNIFSVMSGRSLNQYCRELTCLAQGHNTMTPVGIEPRAS